MLKVLMHYYRFKAIQSGSDLLSFFNENFPDALDLIGADCLIEAYFSIKPAPLVSIKVNFKIFTKI